MLLLHRSRDVLPQPIRFGMDCERSRFWMGCREPCDVLVASSWTIGANMASLLLVSRGLSATGAASFSADSDFVEEVQWAVSV